MGQIIVQAIVTVMTGGTATAATAATMEAAVKMAVNAAIKNLVRQALTQLITAAITGNSLKLDLDSMIKGAVKAGVVSYADSFIDLKVVDHDTTKLAQNIQSTVLTTGVETAVYGGSYIDNLKNNSLNQISAKAFKYIGHESAIKDNLPAKTVIHSLVGGAIAKLKGGNFSAGAIATATGHVVGEYVKKELQNKPNASLQDIENIITKAKAKAISSVVSGAVTIQAKGDISNKELAISQEMSKSVVENNSLRLLITLAKVGRKIYKIKGKLSKGKLKKIFKEEGMDIADDIMTLLDGDITVDDAFALADLVIGTELNSKKARAFKARLNNKKMKLAKGQKNKFIKNYSLSKEEARQWYIDQEKKILKTIDIGLPIKEQAIQAFNQRNVLRKKARILMKDRKAAKKLDKTDPNYTFNDIVKKYYKEGYKGNALWKKIIESSVKSRKNVNKKYGVKF